MSDDADVSNCTHIRRTAARVVRGLSRSPHTTPKSLMDADIVRFLLCLLEEGDEPADEQEVVVRVGTAPPCEGTWSRLYPHQPCHGFFGISVPSLGRSADFREVPSGCLRGDEKGAAFAPGTAERIFGQRTKVVQSFHCRQR